MYTSLQIVLAGITGTFFMTTALYLLTTICKRNFKVVGILGTMVTNHTTNVKGLSKKPADVIIGVLLHYLIGVFFAFIYYYLWNHAYIKADFIHAILLGFLNGCIAALWWTGFIYLHKNPPALLIPSYVSAVGISHILFSTGVYLVYNGIIFNNFN